MAGHMGDIKTITRNLEVLNCGLFGTSCPSHCSPYKVFRIDTRWNVIYVKGCVPGHRNVSAQPRRREKASILNGRNKIRPYFAFHAGICFYCLSHLLTVLTLMHCFLCNTSPCWIFEMPGASTTSSSTRHPAQQLPLTCWHLVSTKSAMNCRSNPPLTKLRPDNVIHLIFSKLQKLCAAPLHFSHTLLASSKVNIDICSFVFARETIH